MSEDRSSFRASSCRCRHIALTAELDFDRQVLKGRVELHCIAAESPDPFDAIFDTKFLTILDVSQADTGAKLPWRLEQPHAALGTALRVTLPENVTSITIAVEYETTPESTGIKWLTPAQTCGKVHPYLFTQCEAIHARTVLPCQDSPGIKCSYEASIKVPTGLTALMSAYSTRRTDNEDGTTTFQFRQDIPIPSYLIALAVGDLVSHDLGERCRVWCEREMIAQCAYEFAETESMLAAAESFMGEYVWGRYDMLVLPPSFPYGGMENPMLTFLTPTLLAGDRSLVSVVAHEIAHSWTGNLVTTRTWHHFWLNEGFTVFVERKILSRLYGEKVRHFGCILGKKSLTDAIELFGPTSPHTCLVQTFGDIDPDDAFSTIPYEKGSTFLFYLETLLGGAAVFEPMLKQYIENFAYETVTTQDFRRFLLNYFVCQPAKVALLEEVDWDTWLNAPGMPPVIPEYDTSLADTAFQLATRWTAAQAPFDQFSAGDLAGFSSLQTQVFLDALLQQPPFTHAVIEALNNAYKFNEARNAEIRLRWQRLCIKAEWTPIFPLVVQFLTEQGRLKYLRPLYRELNKCAAAGSLARETFEATKASYHNLAVVLLTKDLSK
eukprot:m.701133 g.701133  ORF g.701133 m.701133 type:complete len:607 (+) comp58710_c0_seq5:46-1866(+)